MTGTEGRCVVITGTASGIGRSVAMLVVSEGGRVHGFDLNDSKLEGAASSFVGHRGDVTNPADWSRIIVAARADMGRIDSLVHAAGIDFVDTLDRTSLEDWHRVIAVNLNSAFIGVQAAISHLRESNGS